MITRVTPKAAIGCNGVLVVLALATTYVVTSGLNPLDVYKSGSVLGIVVVSFAALHLVSSTLIAIHSITTRYAIRITSGRDPDDVRCSGCGNPLLTFVGSHGQPIRCSECGEWWHNGPSCYSKGLPKVVRMSFGTVCPACRESNSTSEDKLLEELRKDLDFFSE